MNNISKTGVTTLTDSSKEIKINTINIEMKCTDRDIVTALTRSVVVFSRIQATIHDFVEIDCALRDMKEALSLISEKHDTNWYYYGKMYAIHLELPADIPTLLKKVRLEIKIALQLVDSASFKNNHEFIHLLCVVLGQIRKGASRICTKCDAQDNKS